MSKERISAREPMGTWPVFRAPWEKKESPHPSRENLFLAYICAAHAMGLVPRVTLEIPGGARRLDRIFALIQQ